MSVNEVYREQIEAEMLVDIFTRTAEGAAIRQRELKQLLLKCMVWMTVVFVLFIAIQAYTTKALVDSRAESASLADAVERTTTIIERRSPILEYLQCYGTLQDVRNKAQSDYIFAYIDLKEAEQLDTRENPSLQQREEVARLRLEYTAAENRLARSAIVCPEVPWPNTNGD